jgi:hypothetical protein
VWQRKRYHATELIVCVANRGVAGVPGVLWLEMRTADGRSIMQGSLDAGHPVGGGIRQCSFLLPTDHVGDVHLSARIELRPDVFKPLAWACEQPLNPDGSISISVRGNNDPNWRKGI